MHFTVLSALALPQDIPAAASSIPVGEVIGFIESKFLLAQLFRDKAISPIKPDTTMIDAMRWEYLAELMVAKLLAPYNENNEDITYMEFDDRTNEGVRPMSKVALTASRRLTAVLSPVITMSLADGTNCTMARYTDGGSDRCITESRPRNLNGILRCLTTHSESSFPQPKSL